jgi:NAD(P)-dependent dehydrogenase (short-subunit alcohol dehydrogenase family)
VRTWTAELKDRGIRVNAISPGAIDTPIIDAQAATKEGADAIRESFKTATPLSRLGRPERLLPQRCSWLLTKAATLPEPILSSMAD